MLTVESNNILYTRHLDKIVKTGKIYIFAQTQTHHSMEGRALVREAELNEYRKDQKAGNELHTF